MTHLVFSEKRDRDLLLLAHGALPLMPRLRLALHLRRCAECQARLREFGQTSSALAAGIRGLSLPAWSRAAAISRAFPPVGKWLVVSALMALIVAVSLLAWMNFSMTLHPPSHYSASGCRPDLPNSRCR